jgi:hypothetical protein
MAAPLSLSAERGSPTLLEGLAQAVGDDLGGLGQIPLQMTGEA